jgi:hypothetical protein
MEGDWHWYYIKGMLKLLKDDKSGKIFYKGVNVKEAKKCVYSLHPIV